MPSANDAFVKHVLLSQRHRGHKEHFAARQPWENSGYRVWFEAMEIGQTDRWISSPIIVRTVQDGRFLNAVAVQPIARDAKPDIMPTPENVWALYGPHWRHTLHSLSVEDTIVFDTETTGTDPEMDEAVSIAVQSYAALHRASIDYHTLIAPRFPEKLLVQNAETTSAYDIHGIHPDDLAGQPSFADIHGKLREIMGKRNWVCWNADFDVMLLDSLCIRHRLPLIPRNRVICAMKLLSPLAGQWDAGHGAYRWAKLEDMAVLMGLEFPNAHDAAADVTATISVMRWAYDQAQISSSR